MTDRIPLDHLTSDQYDQLCDEREAARATNRRLNLRAQQLESELAAYRRAVDQWEISERSTYVPLRTLAVIAKAAGVGVPERWELHYERVERAEAELRRYTEAESADAAAGSYAGRAETAEAERDELAQRLSESRSGEAILGQRVLGWAALASSHQHWGQRRWNAWKSARSRARNWQERADQAEAAVARVREAARWIRRNYPGLTHVNDRLNAALAEPKDPAP